MTTCITLIGVVKKIDKFSFTLINHDGKDYVCKDVPKFMIQGDFMQVNVISTISSVIHQIISQPVIMVGSADHAIVNCLPKLHGTKVKRYRNLLMCDTKTLESFENTVVQYRKTRDPILLAQ